MRKSTSPRSSPLKAGVGRADNKGVRNDVLAGPRPDGRLTAVPDRWVALGVGLVAVLRGVPFVVMGPKFVLDDWFTLFWAWRDGWWRAAGPTQFRARPLAALLYTVEFGVIGRHPGVIAAIQLLLTGVTAVLVFALARRFMPRLVAACVAVTWVLLPNHTTLDHWASGLIAEVALALLLAGAVLLVRAEDRGGVPWEGTMLLGLSALSYEATIVAAALAVVALPLLLHGRLAWRRVAWQLAALGGVGAYLLASSYHFEHDRGWFSAWAAFPAHFGWALTPARSLGTILGVLAGVGLMLACARRWSPALRALVPAGPARLVVAGLVVIIAGILPFARYPIEPLGVGDRANVVAALGSALAWVGLVGMVAGSQHRRRVVAGTLGAALVVCFLVQGARQDLNWHRAGTDADRTLAAVAARAATLPAGTVVVAGPQPQWHDGVVGLIGAIPEHVQAYARTPGLRAVVVTDPADFTNADPERRVDLRGDGNSVPAAR